MLLVQAETDDGLVGHGISRDAERFAVRELVNRDIGPFLIGRDPLNTEKIWIKNAAEPEAPVDTNGQAYPL